MTAVAVPAGVTFGRSPALSAPVGVGRRCYTTGTGQGKAATTILGDQGDIVTVISDVPYTVRRKCLTATALPIRGSRSMHRSTLQIPTQPYTDYTTTSNKVFGGSRTLEPSEIPGRYPSQHISQVKLAHQGQEAYQPWHSHYKGIYFNKPSDLPSRLHLPTFENKMNNTEGRDIKEILKVSGGTYLTQYTRIHDKLGLLLGPGVERDIPVRRQYNIHTGEKLGPAWQPDNKRVSGNRVLYNNYRKDANQLFIPG